MPRADPLSPAPSAPPPTPPRAAWFARFASPLFLGIQMLILLDMTQNWNDAWVEKGDEDERYLYGLLGITGEQARAAGAVGRAQGN